MTNHEQTSSDTTPPSRRGRKIAAWILAPAVSVGAIGGVAYKQHEDALTQQERVVDAYNQARTTIANQSFQNPRLEAVADTGTVSDGHSTVELKLSLPSSPKAAKYTKEYASQSAHIDWYEPSLTSYAIAQDSNGKYKVVGGGFSNPNNSTGAAFGEPLSIHDGIGTAVVHPLATDPVGDKVALYATGEAFNMNEGKFVTTTGRQYLGAIELIERKGQHEWVAMPNQPQMPDMSSTTAQTPQN